MTESLDVYLDGLLTGRLTRGRDDRVGFQYLEGSSVTSLSISMPRAGEHHDPDVVMPWLDNLLPDNDDVRARWRKLRMGLGCRPWTMSVSRMSTSL
ncbi:MAG: HipA N-terminal domain-containing protein [Tessaracoccus sp.]